MISDSVGEPPDDFQECEATLDEITMEHGRNELFEEGRSPVMLAAESTPRIQRGSNSHRGNMQDEESFSVTSDSAYLVCAPTTCWKCGGAIEVATIYCKAGTVDGESLSAFRVSSVTSVEPALARELNRSPFFRLAYSRTAGEEYWANHCGHCDALQGDFFLHSEPDGPFFVMDEEALTTMKLIALPGRIKLSGNVQGG
jgi:hypothetical protein